MASDLMSILADAAQRARLPAGMRNNNPGNIKYVGQRVPGIVGPSVNTDQGDPQAVFDSPESGMRAMYSLLNKKYAGGKLTPDQIIAGQGGWTPGNHQAALNVARSAGIGPNDDIGFSDPNRAAAFMRGLILQEHGQSGALYSPSMIASAIGGNPAASPGQMPTTSAPMTGASSSQPVQQQAAPQQSFFGRMFSAPQQSQSTDVVPPAAQEIASGRSNSQKSPIDTLFGALALSQQQQNPQFSSVQIQGPSAQQANALNNFLQTLRGRIA